MRHEPIDAGTGLPISYRGPGLDQQLPAFFYFALTGEESLQLDPFNQPIEYLSKFPVHLFSFTLPGHDEGVHQHAMQHWAELASKGEHPLQSFIDRGRQNIDYLIERGIVDPEKIAVGGLSRGSFAAAHLAAASPQIKFLLGFAPLTSLEMLQEFASLGDEPLVKALDVKKLAPQLIHKKIKFYIGNRDLRVSTSACFQTAMQITEEAYQHHVRSPNVEVVITPSVGHKGHGTLPHIFKSGAEWILNCFEMRDNNESN